MSYDIDLIAPDCPTCGHSKGRESTDPTYNLGAIFVLAFEEVAPEAGEGPYGVHWLSGKTGAQTLPALVRALERLEDPMLRQELLKREPSNRWGDLPGAHSVIQRLKRWAAENPTWVWSVT